MTVTEVKQALGSWDLRLRDYTPQQILDSLSYFGHIAVLPGRVEPAQFGDNLLRQARYVGVYLNRDSQNEFILKGVGMAFWLGDSDDKGDVFEAAVTLNAQTFANSVTALLPPAGAVIAGTINSVAGTYTGKHQWQTSRKALDYVTQIFGAEWRVNGDATLDAGTVSQLYVVSPKTILMAKATGRDLARAALAGRMAMATDVEDYTTRVVLLAEGEGISIQTGSASAGVVPYKNLRGGLVKQTRLISESETTATNANARAQLALNAFSGKRTSIDLSTDAFDVKGDVVVGDYIDVYDPQNGFIDTAREVYWEGQPINPVALRCVEMSWPIPPGWTVAFRDINGVWIDLSQYYAGETGQTTITVGQLGRSLSGIGSEGVGIRPNLPSGADATIPAAPVFGTFSTGTYQPVDGPWVKAAILASWTQPLNGDGSTIIDGGHYEIRYRVNAYMGYRVRWGQLTPYRWGTLSGNRWGAPISDPVSSGEWHIVYVGWGQTQVLIQELTPGMEYEFQIRAIDAANPPKNGPYSASKFVIASGDLFAPSTPAAPQVGASRIAIQVVHQLGKASGGTFNLEPDLAYFSVHVGGSASFFADDSNMVGKLVANMGTIQGRIAAVGTFPIDNTEAIWVKVIAVDISGNKSNASAGVQSTVKLIDDAHISDLTVSKITAGTITATWINAGRITTAASGPRVELEGSGLNAYDAAGYQTIALSGAQTRMSFSEPGYVYPPVEIGKTSNGTYGIKVQDLFGETKVLIGQIDPNGGFETENYDLVSRNPLTGKLVSLSTLAHGITAVSVSGSWVPGAGNTIEVTGANVTVRIGSTGKALVMISGSISLDVGEWMDITVGGYRTGSGSAFPNPDWLSNIPLSLGNNLSHTSPTLGGSIVGSVGVIDLAQNLIPGEWKFVAYARNVTGTTPSVTFVNLIVLPY
jgi:hypothetical protein